MFPENLPIATGYSMVKNAPACLKKDVSIFVFQVTTYIVHLHMLCRRFTFVHKEKFRYRDCIREKSATTTPPKRDQTHEGGGQHASGFYG
jgi:hypothetical protein